MTAATMPAGWTPNGATAEEPDGWDPWPDDLSTRDVPEAMYWDPADPPAGWSRLLMARKAGPDPARFYEALVSLCGIRSQAPAPHLVEGITLVSDGETIHLALHLTDGRVMVVDVPLDWRMRGLL